MFRSAGAAVKDRFYVFGGQPTCGIDTVNASCHSLALPTVLGFFDEIFPALYVGTPATTPRRRLAARRMGA